MIKSQERIHEAALRLFAQKGTSAITVSELAEEAGIARGTVYNNVESPDELFEVVAAQFADEMHQRIYASFVGIADPAERLSNGIRFFIRRAHEEPHWGRFLTRFSLTSRLLQGIWKGPPMEDLLRGLSEGRYDFPPGQLLSVLGMVAGSTIVSMSLVLDGLKAWQDAGSETSALVLRGLGIPAAEAKKIARKPLPRLPATASATAPRRRKRKTRQ